MAADRHLELQPVNYVKPFSENGRESSFALVQYDSIMQTWYYTTMHLEALHASFLCVPGIYLLFLAAILDLASRCPPPPPPPPTHTHTHKKKTKKKHNFNTRNGFVALKLMRLKVLLQYLCHVGQNLGIPQIQNVILAAILDLASRWPPNIIWTQEMDSSPWN